MIICQHIPDNVYNPHSNPSTSTLTLHCDCACKEHMIFFIALSYIFQAAKDILYWKGNTSSLQAVLIRQYRLCSDIKSSAGCYATVPLHPNLFLWFDSIDGKPRPLIESSFLPKWKTTQTYSAALLYLLYPLVMSLSLLSAARITGCLHIHRQTERLNDLVLTQHWCLIFLVWFARSLHPTPRVWILFGAHLTLNAVKSGSS